MATCYKAGLTPQVTLNIKDHMALDLLIPRWDFPICWKLESNAIVLHLFFDGVTPKSIAVPLVNAESFLYRVWQFDTKLMGTFPVPRLDFRDDTISFAQGVLNPPAESRLVLNTGGYRVLGHFNRVRDFELLERNLDGRTVRIANLQIPPFRGDDRRWTASRVVDLALVEGNCVIIAAMTYDFL